ncbi:hypothetical protein [Streptomyces sp. NPDC005573]|uniref:hypothetical protein n=1 Tax=Streptomyces sp. NPDC005573 TaxID=3156890 RepID=UPI0033AFA320
MSAPAGTKTRSLLSSDAATCVHQDGDTEETCQCTVAVLTGLPDAYRTGLVHRRALDPYRSIPAQHHHERAAADLRDALTAWGASVSQYWIGPARPT